MLLICQRACLSHLAGNWSGEFDHLLQELRIAIVHANSTRVDVSFTAGLGTWIANAMNHLKEWAGVCLFGALICCGGVFLLWLLCKLRAQQKCDKVVFTQALAALKNGASPEAWLSMLKN